MNCTICDVCKQPLGAVVIDGHTRMGPWAYMCPRCHAEYGCGLGVGNGQEYRRADGTKWVLVASFCKENKIMPLNEAPEGNSFDDIAVFDT